MAYDYERAWSYLLWLLGRRDYSESEARSKLVRKGVSPTDLERVLARARELGLLDDARFAAGWVRGRADHKGELALRSELRRKGVSDAVAEAALAGVDDDTQRQAALGLLAKNRWRFRDGDEASRARAYAFLARRGFPPDVVVDALEGSNLFGEP